MNTGEALKDATCLQVLQVMRRMSGLDLEAIADGMGRNRQTVGCWFGEASADKFIPLPLVPRFCHVLGSPLLLEWLTVQYELLRQDEPTPQWNGAPERTARLLLRGLLQAGKALEMLHDMGDPLTPSQGRQVSEATLLAVATLAAAAREARGEFSGTSRSLRFCRVGETPIAKSRWQRFRDWWSGKTGGDGD